MPTVSTPRKLATGLLLLLAAGCAEGPTSVNQGNLGLLTERTSLSVFLTDGPGNVDAVWADIEKLTIEGQPGKIDLLDGPTGLIEVTELINGQLEQLVNAADLPAGKYTRLMAVIGDAVLLADDGSVYVKGNPNLEAVLDPAIIPETLGALVCPSCTSSGFKIILPGGQTVLEEGAAAPSSRTVWPPGRMILKPLLVQLGQTRAPRVSGMMAGSRTASRFGFPFT